MANIYDEMIWNARNADLFSFVLENYRGEVSLEGRNWMRLKSDHSVVLKRGKSTYSDYSTGEWGNPIDFLMKYMRYSFKDAVEALQPYTGNIVTDVFRNDVSVTTEPQKKSNFQLPVQSKTNKAYKYLREIRKIPAEFFHEIGNYYLRNDNFYYTDVNGNCVFPSNDEDFAELRGTSAIKPFHGVAEGSAHDGYYSLFKKSDTQKGAIVCEGAIDAISLYVLKHDRGYNYCSMSGLKDGSLERIKRDYEHVILAVDNDDAGQLFRDKHSELMAMIPKNKDWNEDLIQKTIEEE